MIKGYLAAIAGWPVMLVVIGLCTLYAVQRVGRCPHRSVHVGDRCFMVV